jgi:hypothetical protein
LWEILANTLTTLYKTTAPNQLMEEAVDLEAVEAGEASSLPFNADECINK